MLATHTCAAGGFRRAPGVVHDRGAEVSTGGRGAAAAVLAWPVQQRLRPGGRAVPRVGRRVTITRLTAQWQDDAEAFTKRSLKASTTCTCGSTGSCATWRCVAERGWKTLAARLSWQRGEAGDSLTRGTPGRAASSPDNDETCWHCQTARARPARRKGVREKPACKAPQTTHQLQSGGYGLGCGAYRTALCRSGTPGRG